MKLKHTNYETNYETYLYFNLLLDIISIYYLTLYRNVFIKIYYTASFRHTAHDYKMSFNFAVIRLCDM